MVDLDVRLPIGADPDAWASELLEIADSRFRLWPNDGGALTENTKRVYSAQCVSSMSAHVSDKNDRLVMALRSAVRKSGLVPRLLVKGGTADFNYAAAWRCPMAAYGPGDSKLDHTDEERVSISEYLTSASILKNALEMFMENNKSSNSASASSIPIKAA
jgi:LysW-gamma-L-lysine carboxypeptidase